jgi:hypothetical protein
MPKIEFDLSELWTLFLRVPRNKGGGNGEKSSPCSAVIGKE